jgi:hypothetical protein
MPWISTERYRLKRTVYSGPVVADADERRERHHVAAAVADVELADVVGRRAIRRLGLQEHAPLPPEAREVVDVRAAEEGLQRVVDLADRTPSLSALSLSTSAKSCGTAGEKLGARPRARGACAPRRGTCRRSARGTRTEFPLVLQHHAEAAGRADAGMAGGATAKTRASGICENCALRLATMAPTAARALALVPRREADEAGAGVARGGAREEAVARDAVVIADARLLGEDGVDLRVDVLACAGATRRRGAERRRSRSPGPRRARSPRAACCRRSAASPRRPRAGRAGWRACGSGGG